MFSKLSISTQVVWRRWKGLQWDPVDKTLQQKDPIYFAFVLSLVQLWRHSIYLLLCNFNRKLIFKCNPIYLGHLFVSTTKTSTDGQTCINRLYRGSPTSTVSTSTNSTCTDFLKAFLKFHLYDFASKSPTCTNSTNTVLHQSPPLVLTIKVSHYHETQLCGLHFFLLWDFCYFHCINSSIFFLSIIKPWCD